MTENNRVQRTETDMVDNENIRNSECVEGGNNEGEEIDVVNESKKLAEPEPKEDVMIGETRDDDEVTEREQLPVQESIKDKDLIKTLVDTKKKELEAIIRTRDIMNVQPINTGNSVTIVSPTTAASTNELKSPRSLSASTTTSKTRRRKNKTPADKKEDAEFYSELRSKSLSWVAAKHAKRFALYWKHEVKEKICILRILEENKQDEIIDEALDVGLFGGKCKLPEWNFEMSVKERPTLFKNNMCISVDNGERTIVLAHSDFLVKAALDQGNERVDALLEEKVNRLFMCADQLLKNNVKSSSSPVKSKEDKQEKLQEQMEDHYEDDESVMTINNVFTQEELGDFVNDNESTLLGYYSTARLKRWISSNECSTNYEETHKDDNRQQPCIEVIIRDGKEWVLPRNYSALKAHTVSDDVIYHVRVNENIKAAEEFVTKSKLVAKHMFTVTHDFIQKVLYETERSFQGSDVVRVCRKFIFEDITLLQESFRNGNVARQHKNTFTVVDPPNPDHSYHVEQPTTLDQPESIAENEQ